ncbi:uncharacterized protein TM35_000035070 [Trypanosoma theileri]|uniref:RING-type domain-containing protein n=1 Tax=Trypanosoma theileri TaxID=67003 RepID=A0A1X0P747_9TRYP|nr:uncharacterized protein TM35_000035070 [Trypanosoma theileri]ORC92754.1 hypothetical protein TM35_000035070 [Trypanosoma theileri]
MLETILLVPFGVALWALSKKQARQQEIIGALEATIISQREELNRVLQTGDNRDSSRLAAYSVLTVMGIYGCLLLVRRASTSSISSESPPSTYIPSPARHEGEECVVCMSFKRDTLFEPCRHLCVCWICSEGMSYCPVCRQKTMRRQFTFIP